MSDTAYRQLKSDPTAKGMEVFSSTYQAWSDALSANLRAMADMNREIMEFYHRRLEEDFEVPARVLSCRTPQQVVDVQSRFVEKLCKDYANQTQRMIELTANATQRGYQSLSSTMPATARENGPYMGANRAA